MQELARRALAVTADPELRLTARHDAAWALAWSGRRTAALAALISVAEEASRDLPALAWDALGSAATVAYQSGLPASRQAVSRTLDLLERQDPPPPSRTPGIDVLRLWIRASADPIGSRNQLLPYLRTIVGSPIEEPSLWRIASTAWLLDESDLAITLLQEAMQRLRAPGVRGTSGGSLTVLGWAYIDTGRWDEALDVAAEAAGLAEANQTELIAASADVITATVLALRGDSAAARRHADQGPRRRRSGRMRAGGRPGPAGPRRRGSRRRQLRPGVHPAPRAVQRGRHAAAQLRLLLGCGRSRRRRGPCRPADGRMRRHRARAQPARRKGLCPAGAAHRPGPRRPRRPIQVRSPFRRGARRPRRGPVALRASPASPRLRRVAAAPAADQRRQTRPDRSPGHLPAARCPVMGAARPGRAPSVRGRCRRRARRTRCARGADPPATPDRPAGQRRPDRPRDRRPALPVTAHGQLAPVPVLSQAGGGQPPPATRRDRPHQHAQHGTRKTGSDTLP